MESTCETCRPNTEPMRFVEKLNRACVLRRMTNQRELADLARVSKSSLNRWINGESMPNVEEALRLARVLEVPLEWLAADDDQETPPASPLSPEEEKILWIVRTMGTEEAAKRLALVKSEPVPNTAAPTLGERDFAASRAKRLREGKGRRSGSKDVPVRDDEELERDDVPRGIR